MDCDWTVACGVGDAVVVLPWHNADGSLRFIDLRERPDAIDQIPEARLYPALANALRRCNLPNGNIFTAKCDVWDYPARLFDAEDLPGFACARGSYLDLLPRDQDAFSNFNQCESILKRWTIASRAIDMEDARAEWVLRPAQIFAADSSNGRYGYAVTLYCWGYGSTPEEAAAAWSRALDALSLLLETIGFR